MSQQTPNVRHELIDYEKANDRHILRLVIIFAAIIAALLLLNWLLLRAICSDTWYVRFLGLPTTCKTSSDFGSRPNIVLGLDGKKLILADGEKTQDIDLSGIAGTEGPAGTIGTDGATGPAGATGSPGAVPACSPNQVVTGNGGALSCVSDQGNLNYGYNFGGPGAGRVINVLGAGSPVQISTGVSTGGPVDATLGLAITGNGGLNNPATSGVAFAKLIGDFGGGLTDGSATIFSGDVHNFSTVGNFAFNAFLNYPGNEIYVNGLNSGFGASYGQMVFTPTGSSLSSGDATTATSDGLGLNFGTGNGGSTSGNGGSLNMGTGSATDGNGGQISFGTGSGSGPTGTGGNFNVFANNGTFNGGAMNFNTGNGGTGDGGNIGFGLGTGGNNGGNFFITSGDGGVHGGGFNFNGGSGTTGFGGGVGFNGGNGPLGGGGFNFNGGNDLTNTFNGGGVGFNGGSGANGGGFNFNGGSGTSNGGGVSFNAGGGSIAGVSNGGGVSINGGPGLNGGTINLNAGNGDLSGADTGGGVTLSAGDGSNPGHIALFAGDALTSSGGTIGLFGGQGTNGGDLNLYGGNANLGGGGNGGSFIFNGGAGDGAGAGGGLSLMSGNSFGAGGTGGNISISSGGGDTTGGSLTLSAGLGFLGNGGTTTITGGSSITATAGDAALFGGIGAINGNVVFGTSGTERARFEAGGEFLVNTTTPVVGKVAVFNGDVNITGVIDPTALVFSDTTGSSSYDPAANNGFRIGVGGPTQRSIYVSPLGDSTGVFEVRNSTNTNTLLSTDTFNWRVGIGTNTPQTQLDIDYAQDAATQLRIANSNAGTQALAGVQLINDTGNVSSLSYLSSTSVFTGLEDSLSMITDGSGGINLAANSGEIKFFTGAFPVSGTQKVTVTSGGNVGIGTPIPANRLDVTDTSTDTPASFTGLTQTCSVDTSGAGGWACTSDERLKSNIVKLDGSLDKLLQLQGVTYNFKSNPDGDEVAGFLAQDVQKILPNLVGQTKDGYLNLNKDGMIPYIVEAIKTQNGKLEDVNKQLSEQGIKMVNISDELKQLAATVAEHDKQLKAQQTEIDDLKAVLQTQADAIKKLQQSTQPKTTP